MAASGDDKLDRAAFQKTMDEVEAGVCIGPFASLGEMLVELPCLAPRVGIWECHGQAEAPTVRNIDNLLMGGQNATAGTVHSHRPTDVDGLTAQTRAVAVKFPCSKLLGWTADFGKAYKQVPGRPGQIQFVVIAQFSPREGRVVFFLALSQVFGSKSAPLNFSRYPALICKLSAVLFRLPLTHCVDDVISVELALYAEVGKRCFDVLVRLCGWKMSEDKKVEPCDSFAVIGVQLDLKPFPTSWPLLSITKKRVQSLVQLLSQILADESWLWPGRVCGGKNRRFLVGHFRKVWAV